MTTDLTAGLPPEDDWPLMSPPDIATYGENHAFWLFDDDGGHALLLGHFEAPPGRLGEQWADPGPWSDRRLAYAFTLPDGRAAADWTVGGGTTQESVASGESRFTCVQPFVSWVGDIEGTPRLVDSADFFTGPIGDGSRVPFTLHTELTTAVEPWVNGTLRPNAEGREQGMKFVAGSGGSRYEQLFRHETTARLDGVEYRFSGTGLRTHRRGARNMTRMYGHTWATGLFPSGRAFGLQSFPSEDPRAPLWYEAWVENENGRRACEVLEYPRRPGLQPSGEDLAIVFSSPEGPVVVEGRTLASTVLLGRGAKPEPGARFMTHTMARYRWNGEETTGLLERSCMW